MSQNEKQSYEARPSKEPVDFKKLREDIYNRFSKTFEYLAKN